MRALKLILLYYTRRKEYEEKNIYIIINIGFGLRF